MMGSVEAHLSLGQHEVVMMVHGGLFCCFLPWSKTREKSFGGVDNYTLSSSLKIGSLMSEPIYKERMSVGTFFVSKQ